ncbi:MAG: hypothetical protein IKI02_03855 [Oscillospiraceae bacterium]|nr:hypothetical protein [Oscillospiraceae bacterium]
MRLLAILLAGLAAFALLALPAAVADAETAREELNAVLERELDPEQGLSGAVLEQIGPYDGAVSGFGERVLALLAKSLGRLKELGLREGLRSLGVILAAALLCALAEEHSRGRALAPLVGGLTVTAACAGPFGAMISLGAETIRSLHRYVTLLLPGMSALMTASGNPSGAAVSGLGIVLFDLLLSLVPGLLLPLVWVLVALSAAESCLGLKQLGSLRSFVKWLLVTGVKLLMWGYTGVLSLTGLVSGSLDAQKLRSLRAAVAGMVPVVGNLVSEASGSLLSAAALLRAGAGLYGMLAVLGLCLAPFFRIALQYLLLKLGTGLCGLFGSGAQAPLLENLSQAMGVVLALTGLACLLSLMILVLCIRTVTP